MAIRFFSGINIATAAVSRAGAGRGKRDFYCSHSRSICCCCLVAQSRLILCDPMDCRMPGFPVLPCPRACSNSCPLSWWCHPIISSSVVHFSSCLQSFPNLLTHVKGLQAMYRLGADSSPKDWVNQRNGAQTSWAEDKMGTQQNTGRRWSMDFSYHL